MKRWSWLLPTILLLALVVACEESTSGADVVAVRADAGTDASVDAGTPEPDAGGDASEPDASPPPASACLTCAATMCEPELDACGDSCLRALGCAEACDTPVCRERCLRSASSTPATDFKRCYLASCSDSCAALQALATGITLYARIHCAAYAFCAPGALPFYYGDQDGCEAQYRAFYALASMLPGSGVSATTLAACAAQETGMTCGDFLSSRAGLTCQIQGRKVLNEPCQEDSQCESSFCPGPDRACSTCQLVPGFGDPCAEGRCGSGLVCGAADTCVSSAALGTPCNANAICEVGNCVAGTCQVPQQLGESCDNTSRFCDFAHGLTCSSGTCVRFTAGKPGESCTPISGQIRTCQDRAGCSGGTCKAPPAIGESCDDTNGPYCTWPNTCRDGKCVGFVFPYPCE
jgi:hypothetical protein